jgi:hypothetical protein
LDELDLCAIEVEKYFCHMSKAILLDHYLAMWRSALKAEAGCTLDSAEPAPRRHGTAGPTTPTSRQVKTTDASFGASPWGH